MRLQVATTVSVSEWNTGLCSIGGTIYHSSIWADYTRAAYPNTTPQFMTLVSDGGELAGMALGFQGSSPHKLIAPFTGHLRLDASPAVRGDDGNTFAEFLRLMADLARNRGNTELSVGSFASPNWAEALEKAGFSLTRYLEFRLDLRPSEDDLWKQLEYKRQKNIRKAGRMGVVIRDLPGVEGISELRRLQGESSMRIVTRGGPDITRKGEPSQDPVKVLLDSGLARIVGAEVGGEVVSAGLFTCFNGHVYHTLSGHGPKALETQAPTLLLWETIKRYRTEGAHTFNFGGCSADALNEGSPEHGVYVYKMGFGGKCVECATGHKILRKTVHRMVHFAKTVLGRGSRAKH